MHGLGLDEHVEFSFHVRKLYSKSILVATMNI